MKGISEEVMHKLGLEGGVGVCWFFRVGTAFQEGGASCSGDVCQIISPGGGGVPSPQCCRQERDRAGRKQARRGRGRKSLFPEGLVGHAELNFI